MDLTPLPTLLVQEFYTNIHEVCGTSFRVFLQGMTIRLSPDVISSTLHIPRVVHPISLLRPFRLIFLFGRHCLTTPQGVVLQRSALDLFPLTARFYCTLYAPIYSPYAIPSSLPLDKARFLYALLYGDSIDLPSFICHHILCTF